MNYTRYLRPYKRACLKLMNEDLSRKDEQKAVDELVSLHQKVYVPLKTRRQKKQRDRELRDLFL